MQARCMCGRKGGRPFGLARRFPMAGIMFSHTIRTPGLPAIVKPAGLRPVRADIKRIRKMRRKTKRTGFFVWSICAILCAVLTASLFLGTALPMASQPEEPVSQAEPESVAPPAPSSEAPPAPSSGMKMTCSSRSKTGNQNRGQINERPLPIRK